MTLRLTEIASDPARDGREADRFRALADAIAEIVFVTSADGRDVHMPRWLAITGQTEAEIRDFGWLDAIHPDDRTPTTDGWARSLARRAPFRTTYRLRIGNGTYRRFDVRAAPVLDTGGGVREWIGVCIDIQDREDVEQDRLRQSGDLRRFEQRFRSLVEAVAAITWSLPPSGRFETEQEGWMAFTGQDFAAHAGNGWLDAVHPDDRASTEAAWQHAHSTGSLYEIEHRLRRADGVHVPMSVRAIPILDPRGEIREWIGFHVDVSRLHRTETALRELTAELEQRVAERTAELRSAHQALSHANANLEAIVDARTEALRTANEEVQRFAYIVSHDLRAPLVNIMGFANELRVLQRELSSMLGRLDPASQAALGPRPAELDRDIGESLDFILQSTSKMDRLIAAILKLSREGRRAFQSERIDLGTMVAEIAASLAHQCQERDARIEIDGELPALTADRLAVEQILTNLVENAIKYLRPGRSGLVRIAGRKEADRILIDVADNGRGIAAKDLDRVFELFRRAGAQDQKGDGIGLAFVRAQVRRLGGSVDCRSVLGEGTVFTVELPAS